MTRQLICILLMLFSTHTVAAPLESWKESDTKQAIIEFVAAVSDPENQRFVAQSERIAVIDNDGTLWAEKPMYFQLLYALDRLKEKAKTNPELLNSPTLKAAVEGDLQSALSGGTASLQEIVNQSHADISVEAFQKDVLDWLATARHPTTEMAYNKMVFQPMLELMDFLRANQFTVYIVSGGGMHFVRAFSAERYGVPPHQVIGSRGNSEYQMVEGTPQIIKTDNILFVDDGPGKPVGIDTHIGKKPIFAAGNSDGDFEMLEWVTSGEPGFGLIVHHTDAEREFAYDKESHIGKLDKAMNQAKEKGWIIVDMKNDWLTVYPPRD